MLQLENNTPFAADTVIFPNEDAVDSLYIIVRATFNIDKDWTLADQQLKPCTEDEYWTEPGKSSIKFTSDYHTGKLSTDIFMVGHAFAPMNTKTKQLDVSLKVGQVEKTVRVFGDRQWRSGKITEPKLFKTMAMVYERAFGGMFVSDGKIISSSDYNPLGRGFAGMRSVDEMDGVPLPNLEDPNDLIKQPSCEPMPACFGALAAHWLPRKNYAGTYDEKWETNCAPYLPNDFDKRFFNMAHPDLVYPGFLNGGEEVEITNMNPTGKIRFIIPNVKLVADVRIADKAESPKFNIESLIIEPNKLKMSLVWRSQLPCDKNMLKIKNIKISINK